MSKEDNKVKDTTVNSAIDVSTNPKELVNGDPIVYQTTSGRKTGKIENVFPDNGVTKAELLFKDNSKLVVKTNDPNLQTLFMKNSNTNNKIYTLFSYEEMKELLNGNHFKNKTYEDLGKGSFNNLRLGGKSKVLEDVQITSNKKEVPETFNVAGRFQIYDNKGSLKVNLDTRARELNLDNKIFGLEFTPEQKEQLKKTGELGLVDGFVNTNTGEISKQWVSVDSQLNKVVTRPEKSVYIDKMFGRQLTADEKNRLQKGEGLLLEFKKNQGGTFKQYVQVSAASTSYNGLRTFSEQKAKELNLGSDDKKKITKEKTVSR